MGDDQKPLDLRDIYAGEEQKVSKMVPVEKDLVKSIYEGPVIKNDSKLVDAFIPVPAPPSSPPQQSSDVERVPVTESNDPAAAEPVAGAATGAAGGGQPSAAQR